MNTRRLYWIVKGLMAAFIRSSSTSVLPAVCSSRWSYQRCEGRNLQSQNGVTPATGS